MEDLLLCPCGEDLLFPWLGFPVMISSLVRRGDPLKINSQIEAGVDESLSMLKFDA